MMNRANKIKQLHKIGTEVSGGMITAYHCGKDIGEGSFSLSFLGTGEGWGRWRMPLGPGIYFHTDPTVAAHYCKYNNEPFIYKVTIPTEGLLGPDARFTENQDIIGKLIEVLDIVTEDAKEKFPWAFRWRTRRLELNDIGKLYGVDKIKEVLVASGVTGRWTTVAGGEEIAIYDTSIINIIGRIEADIFAKYYSFNSDTDAREDEDLVEYKETLEELLGQ
jgi:hypothetical protein